MSNKDTLTTGEAAKWCGVSFRTVLRWIERGELAAYRLPGRGDARIKLEDFVEFLGRNHMPVPAELGRTGTPRVLVVDDEPDVAKLIARVLTGQGYEVEMVHDGFSAGARLAAFQPDLITLDLKMPGLGGIQVLRLIRDLKLAAGARILVISGLSKQDLERAIEAGADDALAKPVSAPDLREAARMLLTSAAKRTTTSESAGKRTGTNDKVRGAR
jgi:two-component system response regulator VicR